MTQAPAPVQNALPIRPLPAIRALPAPIRYATLVLSIIIALSGAAGLFLVWSAARYFSLGMEAVLIISGVFGALCGLGRFRSGPALAVLCVGGAVFTCSVLSEPDLVPWLMGQTTTPTITHGVNLIHLATARSLVGLILCAFAGIAVLVRNPTKSMGYLFRGALIGSPLLIMAVLSRFHGIVSAISNFPPPIVAGILLVVFMVVIVCLSTSIHCFIRAFEVATERSEVNGATVPTTK